MSSKQNIPEEEHACPTCGQLTPNKEVCDDCIEDVANGKLKITAPYELMGSAFNFPRAKREAKIKGLGK